MQIDQQTLTKLEKLSHLRVDESKKEEMISQLNGILNYIDKLGELDTTNVEASTSPHLTSAQLREDEPVSSQEISQSILKNAPLCEEDFFVVPAIIE